jgi:hypothetical protein
MLYAMLLCDAKGGGGSGLEGRRVHHTHMHMVCTVSPHAARLSTTTKLLSLQYEQQRCIII